VVERVTDRLWLELHHGQRVALRPQRVGKVDRLWIAAETRRAGCDHHDDASVGSRPLASIEHRLRGGDAASGT